MTNKPLESLTPEQYVDTIFESAYSSHDLKEDPSLFDVFSSKISDTLARLHPEHVLDKTSWHLWDTSEFADENSFYSLDLVVASEKDNTCAFYFMADSANYDDGVMRVWFTSASATSPWRAFVLSGYGASEAYDEDLSVALGIEDGDRHVVFASENARVNAEELVAESWKQNRQSQISPEVIASAAKQVAASETEKAVEAHIKR